MFDVKVMQDFSSAHQLRGYKGKCEDLHGHNWKVEAVFTAEKLNDIGLTADFCVLREELKKILKQLDHKILNEVPPFDEINPSSENISKFVFEGLKNLKEIGDSVTVKEVSVWETDTACATYYE